MMGRKALHGEQPAPSHCLPRQRRGHVGQRGEAGEGTAAGANAPGRCSAVGEHKARSPALPCFLGSLPRNKGAVLYRGGSPCCCSGQWGGSLGQDAVYWVRVRLSCSPDHFLPYLGNLDFLLPFVPGFSLVKLSLDLLETAAGAGAGLRSGRGALALTPPSPCMAPWQSWHHLNGTRLCETLGEGGAVLEKRWGTHCSGVWSL